MYTIKLLGPILLGACAADLTNGGGYFCSIDQSKPTAVRYYEQGKSCYIEGIFYESCPKIKY